MLCHLEIWQFHSPIVDCQTRSGGLVQFLPVTFLMDNAF